MWSNDTAAIPGADILAYLRAAISAPSIHNSHPWLFCPHDGVIVERRRRLAARDPDGREMYVSVGAAVLNLRIAMLSGGQSPLVRLLPDPATLDLAAANRTAGRSPVPRLAGPYHRPGRRIDGGTIRDRSDRWQDH